MSNIRKIIEDILPNKKLYYRLQELQNCIINNSNQGRILLSIEKPNHSREYCELSLDELELIYVLYPKINRCFYECISENTMIKTYIDFEYLIEYNTSIDHNRAIISCLKILFFYLNDVSKSSVMIKVDLTSIMTQFLVLNAATSSKISYHFIHANPTVLFESTKTLGFYIRKIFQTLLIAVAKHKCSYFNLDFHSNTNSISDIISFLSPHIVLLRSSCANCWLLNGITSVADVAHLIICNKKNDWSLSVDLHVYSKNQQFRMYDSIKAGANNPLIVTSDCQFEEVKSHSYFDILRKSLVTNINNMDVPLIILKDENLFITQIQSRLNYTSIEINNEIIKDIDNKNLQIFLQKELNPSLSYKQENKNVPNSQKLFIHTYSNTIFTTYIPFVNKIITADHEHIGKIHSYAQGNRNNNKLFFNISGNYRFCPKIGTHHKRNSTSVIIDISNNNYAIRCKDPQCDNTILTWHNI